MAEDKGTKAAGGSPPGEGTPAASFEDATERLGAIVRQLEGGELSLEQSLALFEQGVALARTAQRELAQAERRVEELLGIGANGEPQTRPFE